MIYFRARYYDPAIGRFIQRDPIGLFGGINVFAYAQNSPTNFNDPTGLLSPPMHQYVGTQGALQEGFDHDAAVQRGMGSAGVDIGTQGRSAIYAAFHAMRGIDAETRQPIEPGPAAALFAQVLVTSINNGDYNTARHFVEDYPAIGHRGQEYTGFASLFTTIRGWIHIVGDWLTAPTVQRYSINNSAQVSRLEKCGGPCNGNGTLVVESPDRSRFVVDTITGQYSWDRADGSSYTGKVEIGVTSPTTGGTVLTPSSQNFGGISPPS